MCAKRTSQARSAKSLAAGVHVSPAQGPWKLWGYKKSRCGGGFFDSGFLECLGL